MHNSNSYLVVDNVKIILLSFLFLGLSYLGENFFKVFFSICFIFLGLYLIIKTSTKEQNIINFYNAYYLIWLVLIPLTSFEFPLMESMSFSSRRYCLIGNCCISLACVFTNLLAIKGFKTRFFKSFNGLSRFEFYIFLLILLFANLSFLYQLVASGGVGISTGEIKINEPFAGYNLITTLGSLSVFTIFKDKTKRKNLIYIILSFIYIIFCVLSGIRWTVSLLILMILSNIRIYKKNFKLLLIGGFLIVFIFLFANYFRRGENVIQDYYVKTGLYLGDTKTFFFTEIFRYFGMCQRLIIPYADIYEPGYMHGIITAYPFLKRFIPIELDQNIWINGYNALNIIGYLWRDFGYLWPIALIIWSFILCYFYRLYHSNTGNIFGSYFWSIAFFSIILSFYCYIQHYIYRITLMPIYLIVIHFISNLFNSKTNTEFSKNEVWNSFK